MKDTVFSKAGNQFEKAFSNNFYYRQFENSKLNLLPLEMCHKYPCFQQGAPYPLQRSSTCENGSVAERRDN